MTSDAERIPLPQVRDLLQVGRPLPFRVLDAHGRLLLNAGHRLADEDQFDALVERGAWAERPQVEAERAARAAAEAQQRQAAAPVSLFDRWERLLWQFDKLTRALARRAVPGSAVLPFLASLQALLDQDADIALFLCVRQEDRRYALYALTHALHCAVLALLTGRQLGWPADRLTSLGGAALTMNLTLLELQATMAEQVESPTSRQLEQIRAHPEGAAQLLRAAGITDEAWLETVAQHHEQPGGGGYPRGLHEVPEMAQVVRAADVYMAKISPRAKRPAMTPQLATRQLFQQRPNDPLTMAMVKTIGVHPPGSLLQLASGEVAVAIRRPLRGTQPLAATLSDRKGRPVGQTQRRDTAQVEFAVTGPLKDVSAYTRVLPERVYGWVAG